MHFFRVARIGPGFLAHASDGLRVERPEAVGGLGVEHAPRHHGLCPALLERGVVEEAVGARGQDRARER